eukprot:TRINITY_DN5988_c0_g1_i1.p1 TRINITY_DN5988_c0_g1~~TRINITY_DN5988_c0_g1_i1.p1  ORF type:complete len:146 (+),score=26.49 TRINITY_DN5988_c0_g1_i1:56-493(+)
MQRSICLVPQLTRPLKRSVFFSQKHFNSSSTNAVEESYIKKITQDVKSHPVVVYMKGSPSAPQCGYSGGVARLLESEGVDFFSRDILSDNDLRTTLKKFSNWQTFPQVYLNGDFVGGYDIMVELYKSGELTKMLENMNKQKESQK